MTTIFNKIVEDFNAARVTCRDDNATEAARFYASVRVSLLSTLIGTVSPGGGVVPTDDKVVSEIVKFLNNNIETQGHLIKGIKTPLPDISPTPTAVMMDALRECSRYATLVIERYILEEYLPPVFDEDRIMAVLTTVVNISNKGAVMGACKKAAAEQGLRFDGALVNRTLAKYQDMTVIVKNESFDMIEKLIENPPELNDTMKAAIERSKNGVFEINVDRRN